MDGTSGSPGKGSRGAAVSSASPLYVRLVPRLASTKVNFTGWLFSEAWKLVPKSTANALPLALAQLVEHVLGREARAEPVGEVLGEGQADEGLVDRVADAGAIRLVLGEDRLVAEAEGAELEADARARR